MTRCDVIVIGAGAAGLMCAIEAGKRGRSVIVLEHAERIGKKILISGGGRCNFTNTSAGPENYLSANPHFCKSALARYQPADFIALVEAHGIAYHEKKLGQLFCDISSKQIVEMLEAECRAAKVKIQLNCEISDVTKAEVFQIVTNSGGFECESVVIATGGLSFPKIGATDFGYRIARQFGLAISATRPGLVPLLFNADDQRAFSELSGVSFDAFATVGQTTFRENILLTHRGLSGPAILQISNYLGEDHSFSLDLLPNQVAHEWLLSQRSTSKELKTVLGQFLPQRFAQQWCERVIPSRPLNTYSTSELETIAGNLQSWKIIVGGTEGYAKAEVTLGGVATSEISSKTMEARKVRGLYFIGEVVDVTGWLGGYNFQWAWASGHAAGQFV
jgi:predicted Rossmann fold flavoprotein